MKTFIVLLYTGLIALFTIVYIGGIFAGFGLLVSLAVAIICVLAVLIRVKTYKPPLVFDVQVEARHPAIATTLFVICVLVQTLLVGLVLGFGILLAL